MSHEEHTLIQFQSGHYQLALPLPWINRIEAGITFTPNSRGMTPLGWVETDKGRTSVLDLSICLGNPPHPNPGKAQFLFLNDSSRPMVLMVDRVIRARRPHSMAISPIAQELLGLPSPLVRGIALENPPLYVLDFEGLAHQCGLPTYPVNRPRLKFIQPDSSVTSAPMLISFPIDPKEPQQRLGLSLRQVVEILHHPHIEPLPGGPSHIPGFIWWRNLAIPVIDLNLKLFGSSQNQAERIIVARIPMTEHYIGLVCCSDMHTEKDLSSFQPVPSLPSDGDYFLGTFQKGDILLIIPNLKTLCA